MVLYKASEDDIDNSNRQEMIVIKGDVDSNYKLEALKNNENNYDTELLNAVSSNQAPAKTGEQSAVTILRNNKSKPNDYDTLSNVTSGNIVGENFVNPQVMNTSKIMPDGTVKIGVQGK